MKKILGLLTILILTSCATSKECTCLSEVEFTVIEDTLVLPQIHDHFCNDTSCVCVYIEESRWPYRDTIWFEKSGFYSN